MPRLGRKRLFCGRSIGGALALHCLLSAVLWYAGMADETDKAVVVPMDLLVVAHENLDGVEDEPPPEREVQDTPPPPPEPIPDPPPDPEPPPVPQDAVVQVKDDKPKVEQPKPREKTKEEIAAEKKKAQEDRLKSMRESVVKVKDRPAQPAPPPRNNGRTEMRPPDWEKLLNQGYKPSSRNEGLGADEYQRCLALIQRAFHEKWDIPAWNDQLREMLLRVEFGPGGSIKGYALSQSSGDPAADRSVLLAASKVAKVHGLSSGFLNENRFVTVRFKVTPQ